MRSSEGLSGVSSKSNDQEKEQLSGSPRRKSSAELWRPEGNSVKSMREASILKKFGGRLDTIRRQSPLAILDDRHPDIATTAELLL